MKDCKLRILISSLLLVICATGCRSTNETGEPRFGGLATTSALLVAVPMLPFAEGYHLLNQTHRKDREERDSWMSLLDPVYQKRIDLILERSPNEDAQQILSEGFVVYFPSVLRREPRYDLGAYYPAVGYLWDAAPDKRENVERIRQNALAEYLWELLSNDPFHEEQDSIPYFSDIYKAFISARFRYMEEFNLTMYNKASNKAVQVIP